MALLYNNTEKETAAFRDSIGFSIGTIQSNRGKDNIMSNMLLLMPNDVEDVLVVGTYNVSPP